MSNPVEIVLTNQKGGVGKSTLSALLCLAFAEAGHRVAYCDLDPQRTLSRFTALDCYKRYKNLGPLATPPLGYNLVITDTPRALTGRDYLDAVARASLVVIVAAPGAANLWSTKDTHSFLLEKFPQARVAVLGNQLSKGRILSREFFHNLESLGLPGAIILPDTISHYANYEHTTVSGWKSLSESNRAEFLTVTAKLLALAQNA
jgi:chromosome partitioning protein